MVWNGSFGMGSWVRGIDFFIFVCRGKAKRGLASMIMHACLLGVGEFVWDLERGRYAFACIGLCSAVSCQSVEKQTRVFQRKWITAKYSRPCVGCAHLHVKDSRTAQSSGLLLMTGMNRRLKGAHPEGKKCIPSLGFGMPPAFLRQFSVGLFWGERTSRAVLVMILLVVVVGKEERGRFIIHKREIHPRDTSSIHA